MNRPLGVLAAAAFCLAPSVTPADGELISLMAALQTYTHKLQLSLDRDTRELAAFYLHELEETIEAVNEVEEYDGHPIGQLSAAMLSPALERLGAALDGSGQTAAAGRELDALLGACNACHTATEHAYIVIRRNDVNPYAQSFEPR